MKYAPLFIGAACFGSLALTGCEQAQEAKNAYSAIATTTKAAKEINNNMEASQSRLEERKKRGDTLALNYKELQKYLPASPAGYTPDGDPEGQSTNMANMHMSTASQKYKKGDQTLRVSLIDYNSAAPLFMGATAMMNTGMEMEDDNQLMRGIKMDKEGVKGMETLEKKEHKATVTLGIGDRFLATVEASGQDNTDLVKSVAESLSLDELAKK
jgi:outer membrane murein-binding lipoprotein Lpp